MTTPMPALLANRYQVLRVLGDGGFGTTYLAEDTQMPSNRRCVVKQLKPVEDNPQIYELVKERFQREAAILETLGEGYDQIPHLYAYFSQAEQFFLVEEWVEGETLTEKIRREGLLPEVTVRQILARTLPVLGYIHQQQMVHRDIKPDNIILRQRDGVPVLIDFGAVKETMGTVINSQGNSSRSIVVGTPGFMPSEQMAGRPLFSSDLYSLGLTAIYLLTGKIPQDLPTDLATGAMQWRHFAPGVTPGFANLLDRAIQLQPRDRFHTASEMLSALESFDAATQALHPMSAPPPLGGVQIPGSPGLNGPQTVPQSPYPTPQYPPQPQVYSSQPVYSNPPQPIYNPGAVNSAGPTAQIPGYPQPSTPPLQAQASPSGDWKKAAIIGGFIGLSILGGAVMLRAQIGNFFGDPEPNTAQISPSPNPPPASEEADTNQEEGSATPAVGSNPPPVSQSPATDPSNPNTWETNAQIIGKAGQKNIRSGPGTDFSVRHIAYPGDRVQVISEDYDKGGYLWYNIYFPNSGAEGWLAAQLLKIDGQAVYQPPKPDPKPSETPAPAADTNATIVGTPGSKNIRSGPGTNFGVAHIAYPGDRVKIISTDYDSGGYQWFEIYFPKSGASGWIAAQLIQTD
ncbi:serine/threonine protein kinase [Lyngbya confervoides]|uniref:non-specific serine/threonine protein kinase n=1 Tax=Lyngbya confervoides BDU141951 TaxID=1574623 RepID=A0ABD4T4F9_9CYAN|nr:serine/threonine protein kinase [Lyngbya confervoides]MCM1983112.1 SH3 domain-containing protein [Lyngbya confervoides BDU141951]